VTLCVYALSSSVAGAVAVKGVAGERLRAVTVGSVAAIVGEMPRLPPPTEANLKKYHLVVQQLSRQAPALLPARYGSSAHDVGELASILQTRQDALRRRLKAVRHRVQMTVRVFGAATRQESAEARATKTRKTVPRSGAEYLRARARQAAHASEIPQFDGLRTAVRRWVREERVEKQGPVFTVYHLVPRGSVDGYERALERTARKMGVRILITGPWAAHAFAEGW
jgi:hypothetical protein